MSDLQNLRETAWRRSLTPEEEVRLRAALAEDPKALADWELEAALTRKLGSLRDAPVPSNFAARVAQAVERERQIRERQPARWSWQRLIPRVAFALSGVFTVAAVFILVSHQQRVEARQLAESIAAISSVSSLPSPEVLQDFEAIRRLTPTPAPDEQLLALFE